MTHVNNCFCHLSVYLGCLWVKKWKPSPTQPNVINKPPIGAYLPKDLKLGEKISFTATIYKLAEKINNSEVQISALKEEAQKINDDNIEKILAAEKKSSKILEQSQINAKELYNNVENEVLEARNKLDALKKEALAIQEQITEDNKILKKLQNAKESAKKALGV